MEITEKILEQKFREYNLLYFQSDLPLPRFGLLKSYSICGYFSCAKITGRRRLKRQKIEMSCRFDWGENDFRDVLVHEMIHYYLAYKHIDNGLTHGEAFQKMSQDFNQNFGLHITEKVDCSQFKPSPNASRFMFYMFKYLY
jgi:hypothetical protein